MPLCRETRADASNLTRTATKWRIRQRPLKSENEGQRNVWQGNKTKVISFIALPIIPLPMTFLLDGPSANAGRLE
jgi:hypothetical protein